MAPKILVVGAVGPQANSDVASVSNCRMQCMYSPRCVKTIAALFHQASLRENEEVNGSEEREIFSSYSCSLPPGFGRDHPGSIVEASCLQAVRLPKGNPNNRVSSRLGTGRNERMAWAQVICGAGDYPIGETLDDAVIASGGLSRCYPLEKPRKSLMHVPLRCPGCNSKPRSTHANATRSSLSMASDG